MVWNGLGESRVIIQAIVMVVTLRITAITAINATTVIKVGNTGLS